MRTGLVLAFLLVSVPSVYSCLASPQVSSQPPQVASKGIADSQADGRLLKVKRIYVDSFGDDTAARQIQAMLSNSLSETKRFVITENKEKADAVMKGSTLETTSQELHSSSELTVAGRAATGDAEQSTQTTHEARIAVRLVATDGDVIWTSTQESRGAKYKGPGADVADKVVKQLIHDLEKLEKRADR